MQINLQSAAYLTPCNKLQLTRVRYQCPLWHHRGLISWQRRFNALSEKQSKLRAVKDGWFSFLWSSLTEACCWERVMLHDVEPLSGAVIAKHHVISTAGEALEQEEEESVPCTALSPTCFSSMVTMTPWWWQRVEKKPWIGVKLAHLDVSVSVCLSTLHLSGSQQNRFTCFGKQTWSLQQFSIENMRLFDSWQNCMIWFLI